MARSQKLHSIMRSLIIFTMALILLVMAYETYLVSTSDTTYIYVVGQEWVSQRIAKDVLILKYGSPDEKVTATSELQNVVPYFEENQKKILASNEPEQLSILIRSSQIDFVNIDTAAKKILAASNKPIDPIQAQIILDHERSYFLVCSQLSGLLIENAKGRGMVIYTVIMIAKILLLFVNGYLLYILEKWKVVNSNLFQNASDEYPESLSGSKEN